MGSQMSRKAQITIYIIIALLLIVAFLLVFMIKPEIIITKEPVMGDPTNLIERCARDATYNAIEIMLPQGGYLNPTHYKMYDNQMVEYLCYTKGYYFGCTHQEPMYINHLKEDIINYTTPIIEDCFYEYQSDLMREGFDVRMSDMDVDVELENNRVVIHVNRKIDVSKNDVSKSFDGFTSILKSPIYNLAYVALEIVNQESRFCNFEYMGFQIFYPRFKITKKNVGSSLEASTIYMIYDKYTDKQLNIAIRSCQVPPGV